MKRRFMLWLLSAMLLLASCGGNTPQPESPVGPDDPAPEPLVLQELSLEIAAPQGSGGDFPAAARDFSGALQETLEAEGIRAEKISLSFSRADAVTAQALAEGGVELGVLNPLSALREEGVLPLAFMSRSGHGPSVGVIAAAESAYGAQLASRAAGSSPISWAEWNRAVVGAVESDAMLYMAADYALTESADHGLSQLSAWRNFKTEEELLAAMENGEVDAALLRKEVCGDRAVLLETDALYEAVFAVSAASEDLADEQVRTALMNALAAAAKTDAGMTFLQQYACGAWAAAEQEETEALRRLAKWEDIQ